MKKILTIILAVVIGLTLFACLPKATNGDQYYANKVIELIDNIPLIEDLVLDDQPQVAEARDEFDALTETQQDLVTNINVLLAAELRIIELLFEQGELDDQQKANIVIGLINEIPAIDLITHDDATVIHNAKRAFDLLTDKQQELVTNSDILFAALDKLEQLPVVFNPVQLFYLSDLHGFLLRDDQRLGMAYVGNLIEQEQARTDVNTIVIGGGDMLHGTMISNYFHGASTMHVFNEIGMDAFVIGNHEFNWGLSTLLGYWNGQHEIQADFPLLGANLYYDNTNFTQRPQYVDPFTIIENDDGSKVGIIGLIGLLARSISAMHMDGYIFRDPLIEATEQVRYLQNNFDLDLIVVVLHDGDQNDSFGQAMANLGVDAVFSAHDHIPVNRTLTGLNGKIVPTMQAGAHARSVGHIEFSVADNEFSFLRARLLDRNNEPRLNSPSARIAAVILEYELIIDVYVQTVVATANRFHSTADLTQFMSRILAQQYGAYFGFHNSGGTRGTIANNQQITISDVLQLIPFENHIMVMEVRGDILRQILNWGGDFAATSSYRGMDINDIVTTQWYLVVTHDFIYGRNSILSNNARNVVTHDILIGDLLLYAVKQQGDRGQRFDANHVFVPSDDFYAPMGIDVAMILPSSKESYA